MEEVLIIQILLIFSCPPVIWDSKPLKKLKNIPLQRLYFFQHAPPYHYAIKAIKAGASGYLTKSSAAMELVTAVNQVVAGKIYIIEALAILLAEDFGRSHMDTSIKNLSDR